MFIEVTPSSWDEAKQIANKFKHWIFRGHTENTWCLKSSLERAAEQFKCEKEYIWIREKVLLHDFQCRAHHYIQAPPSSDEVLEWLSLVQHYGGPTRLLDFTKSFYVGSFFAMETATSDACVWAVNNISLQILIEKQFGKKWEKFSTIIEQQEGIVRFAESFLKNNENFLDFVVSVRPVRMNERLAIQKGVFLFPCNVKKSFEQNLCTTFQYEFDTLNTENAKHMTPSQINEETSIDATIEKINLPRDIHYDAYMDLYSMNLDASSLFPGLDGFARSLRYHLRVMEWKPEWDTENHDDDQPKH